MFLNLNSIPRDGIIIVNDLDSVVSACDLFFTNLSLSDGIFPHFFLLFCFVQDDDCLFAKVIVHSES